MPTSNYGIELLLIHHTYPATSTTLHMKSGLPCRQPNQVSADPGLQTCRMEIFLSEGARRYDLQLLASLETTLLVGGDRALIHSSTAHTVIATCRVGDLTQIALVDVLKALQKSIQNASKPSSTSVQVDACVLWLALATKKIQRVKSAPRRKA